MQVIQVALKDVYGVRKVYPVCEKGLLLAKLVGMKTFTDEVMRNAMALGYRFEVAPQQLPLAA